MLYWMPLNRPTKPGKRFSGYRAWKVSTNTFERHKMTLKQKRAIIVQALKSCNNRIESTANNSNPQIVAMWTKNKGYQSALEDVLLLIDGNDQNIKCLI